MVASKNKSKMSNAKVKMSNAKVSFKKGINAQAEAMMKRTFEPLFSSIDSKAQLTFVGVEHSVIEWVKDGEQHERPVLKVGFSVLDITHENPVVIAITCDYRYSPENKLGVVLGHMGYKSQEEEEVVDADDEFGTRVKPTAVSEIFNFLRGQCGLVYKAALRPATRKNKDTGESYEAKGLWDIVPDTLEPYIKRGLQVRVVDSDSVSDEEFEKPQIDMESEVE